MKFVEATLIMPITILITCSMILLTVSFFEELKSNVKEHEERLNDGYKISEEVNVRIIDKAKEIA